VGGRIRSGDPMPMPMLMRIRFVVSFALIVLAFWLSLR
jgi:hypothetical protein